MGVKGDNLSGVREPVETMFLFERASGDVEF